MANDEKRKHPRIPVNEDVLVGTPKGSFNAVLRDISEDGAGVSFDLGKPSTSFEIGDPVTLGQEDGAGQANRAGRIVRIYEDGFGMRLAGDRKTVDETDSE